MIDADSERDPVDVLAEEFAERHRRGENPRLGEYIEQHPELADEIRQTFPAVMLLEQLKPTRAEAGPAGPPRLDLDKLGEYRILREVGRGGMGVVYEAEQQSLGRRVALKVLAGTPGFTPNALRRFTLEARAAARLHHTNIVPVFGVGIDQGIHYYVMQLIDGRGIDAVLHDLRRLRGPHSSPAIASGSTTLSGHGQQYWSNVARVTAQVGDALHYAHQAGTLHRDIKPSNLLLDPGGTVWVSDFGLAKLHDEPDITRTTDVIGTVRYMAPERFAGTCDARSDIYSLGLVLYELLTLRPAFDEADRSRLVHQITHEAPRRPREIDPDIPRDLETIALKAMAREPRDRYATAQALADDLRRFLEDRPIQARRIGRVERLRRWCRRNPLPASLAACVALLLVATAIASTVVAFRYRQLAGRERTARHDADEAKAAAELALAEVYPNNGIAASRRGNAAEAMLWFAAAAKYSPSGSDAAALNTMRVRTWGDSVLCPIAMLPVRLPREAQLIFHPGGKHLMIRGPGRVEIWDISRGRKVAFPPELANAETAVWSDDGVELAVADGSGRVGVFSFPQLTKRFASHSGPVVDSIALDSERRRLLVCRGAAVEIHDYAVPRSAPVRLSHPAAVTSAQLSPDGSLVLTGCRDGQARVFALSGAEAPFATVQCSSHLSPVWVDAGRRFVCATEKVLIWRDAQTGAVVSSTALDELPRWLTTDSHGHRLAVGMSNRALVFDGQSAAQVVPIAGSGLGIHSGIMSPDGLALVTISEEGTPSIWSLPGGSRDGAAAEQLKPVGTAAFSADSRLLALAHPDGMIRVYARPVTMWRTYRVPLAGGSSAARFDRTGKLCMPIGVGTSDGTLRSTQVYEVKTGRPLGPPLQVTNRICSGDFAPDATHLITVGSDRDEWSAQFWDWRRGERVAPPVPLPDRPLGVQYDRDGRAVAVLCAAGELMLIDASTKAVTRNWQTTHRDRNSNYILHHGGLAFSPDAQSILTWGTSAAELWDAATGRRRWPAIVHESLCSDACFSPDGRHIATAGWDGTARVWDAATGSPEGQPLGHPSQVFSVQFMPGNRLLTGCADGTARVWDWRANQLVHALYRDDQYAYGAAATPDGRWVITGSGGKSVRLWDSASGNPVTPAIPVSSLPWIIETTPDGRYATIAGFTGIEVLALPVADTTGSPLFAELASELASNNRLNRGALVPLGVDEWSRRWEAFRQSLPAPDEQALAWHRQEAFVAQEARDPQAAIDHLTRLAAAGAPDWTELEELGGDYGLVHRWPDAEVAFAKAAAARPRDWELRLDHGDALIALGRMDEAAAEFSQAGKVRDDRTWMAGNWWALSPYRPTLHDPLPPERQLDVGKPVPPERPDDPGGPANWRLLKNNTERVQFGQYFQNPPHVASFALTHVFSNVGQPVALSLGSDDLCRVWVNGEMRYEYDGPARPVQPDQGGAVITLRCGWNTILAKLVSIGNEQSLYARLSDRPIDLASAYLHQKQPDSALEQYSIGLQKRPRDRDLLAARADLLGRLGRFNEAAGDLATLTEIDPSQQWNWYRLGSVRLQLGDTEVYRSICHEVMRRWGDTDDPILAERTAKLCALTADGAPDAKALVALVEKSVTAGSDARWLAWFHTSTGMVHYRAAQYPASLDWLDKVIRANAGGDVEAMARLFTAMAQARLGRMDDAKKSLDRAVALMKQFAEPGNPMNPAWNDWINFQIVLGEARALVK